MVSRPQTRVLSTSHGTNREAFSGADWALFLSLVLTWGGSFLFIAIGLDHFHPGLVTFLRVGFGAGTRPGDAPGQKVSGGERRLAPGGRARARYPWVE